ncbi:conserved hypothetical protein [Hyphomicrobiales bacterium]|nr:conserved hypothetical protein [Hyphomicrobiales bacterium]CAH1702775.1 hypothetical protein BOSEA1005_30647 [Hyphomicrobiales bacterium]CAI0346965.1 conserved hypothetical protein [Hyphomicrobiales bacterium]
MMDHQDILRVVREAFPNSGSGGEDPTPIGDLYGVFFASELLHPINSWEDITLEDMQEGHFGALLGLMSGPTFVAWLPAWLVHVGAYGLEVPRALISFAGSFSPEVSAETGKLDRLRDRVTWLDPAQRRAVALIGRSIAGREDVIRYCELDVGESVSRAWGEYALHGYRK